MSRTPTQKDDLALGKASELSNIEILQLFLNTTLTKNEDDYAVFDFEDPSKTIFCELKTRRIPHDRWDTALIGLNKVAFCNAMPEVEFWFAYCYLDGVFVVKYDKELFDTFTVEEQFVRSSRSDAANNGPSKVCLIPRKYLQKIDMGEMMKRRERQRSLSDAVKEVNLEDTEAVALESQ